MSNLIITEKIDRSFVITFNNPEQRSPLSIAVVDELTTLINEIKNDGSVNKVIFTGVGNIFAAGADLREIAAIRSDDVKDFARMGQHLMSLIENLAQKTIAAVNGLCYGGALDLTLACDERIASQKAKFCHPGASIGIMTGWGGTQRLPRLIGQANALEMFMTAEPVNAQKAFQIGLIKKISDDPLAAALSD